jgi:hypothetical protein
MQRVVRMKILAGFEVTNPSKDVKPERKQLGAFR